MSDYKYIRPPRLADRFFNLYCKNELAESILGDLHERFEDYRSMHSLARSRFLYWMDVIRFMNRHTMRRRSSRKNSIPPLMLKNYTLVALRNIRRNFTFTGINVVGLAISMAVCLLIIMMINDQNSYDKFHSKADDIYRVVHDRANADVDLTRATIPVPLGGKMKAEYPGLDQVVRFRNGFSGEVIDNGKAIGITGYFTDPSIFNLFDFKLAAGNTSQSLATPFSVVLRHDIAEKLFRDEDPIGKILNLEDLGQFTVTGVLEEFPGKTHIEFEALVSFSTSTSLEEQEKITKISDDWENGYAAWVYFNMKPGQQMSDFATYLNDVVAKEKYTDPESQVTFSIQKMTEITPGPLMANQIGMAMPNFFVIGLVILAILIMTCAAFNYANLSVARALTRFKEVGVRKVMGSTKGQLIFQFVLEAILVSFFALVLSLAILVVLIPAFEGLKISSQLNWSLDTSSKVYLQFLAFSLVTGLFTGFFPALYLAAAKPIQALKGTRSRKASRFGLKKSLITVQLVISLVLIISSSLVYRQTAFMIEKDYGFTKDNVVNIELQGQDFALLKPELEKLPFVEKITASNNIPSVGRHDVEDMNSALLEEPIGVNYFAVDENYIDNLDLELIAGTNFTPKQQEEREIILNETAVQSFGFEKPEAALGKNIVLEDSAQVKVVGVVKNYNYMMLFMEIEPMALRYLPEEYEWAQVKISGTNMIQELEQLEETWDAFDPNHDFQSQFLDEQIEDFYANLYDVVYIIGLISILSAIISGMGLLGIAAYSIQTRMKEVGIRKVLGASGKDLVLLLGKGFLVMILIATTIGGLLSYFGNKMWLDLFAYRIEFGFDVIAIGFLFIALIGGLTIGTQTLKAMRTNPSDVLRDE